MHRVFRRAIVVAGVIGASLMMTGPSAGAADLPDKDAEPPAAAGGKKSSTEPGDNKTVVIRCVPSRSCDFDEDLGACVKNRRASRSIRCKAVRDVVD